MARFDKTWFNPLYFIIREIVKDQSARAVLVYGGKSSSKTVSICQSLAVDAYCGGASTIAYRKESAIIPTTLKKSFTLGINSTRLFPAFENQDRRFVCHSKGTEIVMKGLDDPEKAKGIESYKYVYLDELNHFEQSEYEQFNLSLRGMLGQKIFASWNPVDENSWVKVDLVDKYNFQVTDKYGSLPCEHSFVKISECGKVILIKTTYEDNYWIVGSPNRSYGFRDENLISEYNTLRTKNNNSYKVNVLGEWGKTTFGGEFLKNWRSEIHTGDFPYDPQLAVYALFDENVNPYFPCGLFQLSGDEKTLTLIHAIALKNPDNTIGPMCREIARKLKQWDHKEALFIGGDPTSQKDDVKQEKGHDLFRLIMDGLKKFNPRRAVLSTPPSVRLSADFLNTVLGENLYGLTFRSDRNCRIAILDYENTKEDKNGKVDKKTVTDPVTKVSYQPHGHFVDLTRYGVCYIWRGHYALYQRGGKPLSISVSASSGSTYK